MQGGCINKTKLIVIISGMLILHLTPVSLSGHTLKGRWMFHAGNITNGADPTLDDSKWTGVGPSGDGGLGLPDVIGWYRLKFRLNKDEIPGNPAILIDRVSSADQTFLNGVKIGQTGKIGMDYIQNRAAVRLYPVPRNLLMTGRENTLAVRVLDTYWEGGISGFPVLGDWHELEIKKMEITGNARMADAVIFTFFIVFITFISFVLITGVRSREYIAFDILMINYFLVFILDSSLLANTAISNPWIQRLTLFLAAMIPASAFAFVWTGLGRGPGRLFWTLTGLWSVLGLFVAWPLPLSIHGWLLTSVVISGLAMGVWALWASVRAWLGRQPESGALVIGILMFIAGNIGDIAGIDIQRGPFALADIGMMGLMFSGAYGLILRFARFHREKQRLAGRVLQARDEERRLISRNIHDSLGQSVLAVKLNLQMISLETESENSSKLVRIVKDMNKIHSDLRLLAQDIRPPVIEEVGLLDAIRWLAQDFEKRTNIPIKITIPEMPSPSGRIMDNLYGIAQEALNNIMLHSDAATAEISLRIHGKKLIMEVKDNGSGFDVFREKNKFKGMGLSTMQERADILTGTLKISSVPGMGTSVSVEVPL